jgi:hypothetical protein
MVSASPAPRPHWHRAFLALLPEILTHAKCAFSFLKPEARAEAVQEVVANACQAYSRLVEQNKTDITYPIALARYGVKQTRDHRKVGGHLNVQDVLSRYCDSVANRLDMAALFSAEAGRLPQTRTPACLGVRPDRSKGS